MLEKTCVNATRLLKHDVRFTLLLRVRGVYLLIIEQRSSNSYSPAKVHPSQVNIFSLLLHE